MQALAASPDSLPVAVVPQEQQAATTIPLHIPRKPNGGEYPMSASAVESVARPSMAEQLQDGIQLAMNGQKKSKTPNSTPTTRTLPEALRPHALSEAIGITPQMASEFRRPIVGPITTNPSAIRRNSFNPSPRPPPLNLGVSSNHGSVPQRKASTKSKMEHPEVERGHSGHNGHAVDPTPTPTPSAPIQGSVPLPPMSLHTHLQLELAGVRPSPLYIYRHQSEDIPFVIAVGVLLKWWAYLVWKEVKWVVNYVYQGIWRLWRRGRRGRSSSRSSRNGGDSRTASEAETSRSRVRENLHSVDAKVNSMSDSARLNGNGGLHPPKHAIPRNTPTGARHRRTKSMPSNLTSFHKADLLQGAVIVCSSLALMNVDASRMYHFIRAQSAMKLYVIFNLLEVGDRLLSAIGQDILECLFSSETLSRNSSGRSKILLPFGMFLLTLAYNVIHAVCLFYQVITLNVAVNSYSNALLSLLMSNQFVEIKGSVFKRIEKENLFQLTCADVVERFQLWIILIIIGLRNIVEVGGLSVPGAGSEADGMGSGPGPVHTASNLPASFTLLPSWMFSGEVLSPFLIVIGSEMLVDWIKHAYINKFNNVKPTIYRRMLDILCKDYYTNAFGAPALTRRIGLPLLPLSCLFIRASVQIYHMFLSTHLPPPIPTSTATMDLSVESSVPSSPAMTAALEHLDSIIRNALGRAVYGHPYPSSQERPFWAFTSDDAIALLTMTTFFFVAWVILLVFKLILGMALLRYSRDRYAATRMKEQVIVAGQEKRESFYQPGKRIGGWGAVEIGEDRRRMIYADDPEGLKRMEARDRKGAEASKKMEMGDDGLEKVTRYEMIAKRIW
ncbi:eukaryotic membrane protein family [Apiospora kogelbergensis]|uniref:Eukaryotic membrane protein family n=1 Tax=Apiospora kogelbergensis TaxID=1337665 RepID=A0AAW0R0S8_9PEZI